MASVSASPPPRHLTDVAFRLGPPGASSVWQTLPSGDDSWTLDEVLVALARGARVVESHAGWRLLHAHRRPGLAAALDGVAVEVRTWVRLGLSGPAADLALRAWPERVRLYLAWLDAEFLPSVSEAPAFELMLRPGVKVVDRVTFRAGLQARLEAGPDAASAPGLMADLTSLFATYGDRAASSAAATPRRALAA